MRRYALHTLTCLASAALSPSAWAQQDDGFPIDVELLRPGLSPMGGFGVDAPHAIAPKTWSVGALFQYENAPLRLYDGDALLGPLVNHRTVVQVHAGISASKRTSFSLMVPIGAHFGSADVDGARDGAALGDMALTGRVHIGPWGRFSLGVLGTLMLPTATDDQYMGERLPRLRAGLLGYTDLGRVKLLTNLLAHVREPVKTNFDFTAGSELQIDLGVQGAVIPDTLDLIGELVTRVGLEPSDDGGRLTSEIVAGVRYQVRDGLRLDLALGRGLTEGYGSTEIRAILGLSWVSVPKPPPEPEPEVEPPIAPDPVELPEAMEEAPPEPPPPPPPVATLTGEQIVIRDPIAFAQGTTRLLSSSGPVLDSIADVILGEAAIGHVVIEGHASQEGGYAYNYALSRERARVIYEALILRGVHPKRMSYRGAGEVDRVAEGDTDEAKAKNRRVVFQVVRQYQPGEVRPSLGTEVLLPWSGDPHTVVEPEPEPEPEPVPEPEVTPEPEPRDAFDGLDFQEPAEDDAPEPEEDAPEPEEPTATPEEPTATPEEPTATPEEPTATPEEPTGPSEEPGPTPDDAEPAPGEPTTPDPEPAP